MTRSWHGKLLILSMIAVGCAPWPGAKLRVVNAITRPLSVDVALRGQPVASRLGNAEASLYSELPAGTWEADVIGSDTRESVGKGSVWLDSGTITTLAVAGAGTGREARLVPLVHAFATPREGSIRVRVVHAASAPVLTLTLGDGVPRALRSGADSGAEGLELPAGRTSTLRVEGVSFLLPALPSQSELLVLVVDDAPPDSLALLGVAPSAALGFFGLEAVTP